jgi:hypothetical protein
VMYKSTQTDLCYVVGITFSFSSLSMKYEVATPEKAYANFVFRVLDTKCSVLAGCLVPSAITVEVMYVFCA